MILNVRSRRGISITCSQQACYDHIYDLNNNINQTQSKIKEKDEIIISRNAEIKEFKEEIKKLKNDNYDNVKNLEKEKEEIINEFSNLNDDNQNLKNEIEILNENIINLNNIKYDLSSQSKKVGIIFFTNFLLFLFTNF